VTGEPRLLARLFVATGRRLARLPPPSGWLLAAAMGVATALAYVWKQPIAAFFEGHPGGPVDALAELANVGGAGVTVVAAGVLLLVVGRGLRKDSLVQTALVLGAAGAWCWLLTTAGQVLLAEQRPSEGGEMGWLALGGHGVSGHAAAAALLFWPVRDMLAPPRLRNAVSVAMLSWAAWVGWSRMWLGMHHLWNVILGLALGFLTGRAGVAAWREIEDGV